MTLSKPTAQTRVLYQDFISFLYLDSFDKI